MPQLPATIVANMPPTALAPMQNVTTHEFIHLISRYGAPDFFFTEFMRVHQHSTLEKPIVKTIIENNTGRPVFPQLIGENLDDLKRTVDLLRPLPVAGIDLNLGCPAPKVYKKNVGGGLLRDPDKIHAIIRLLREATGTLPLTIKMRIGFANTESFTALLHIMEDCQVDLVSIHARTVKEMYRGEPHYEYIRQAARQLSCPVMANGNLTSVQKGLEVMRKTGCAGLMIGRSAIRNPWIFRQLRETWQQELKTGKPDSGGHCFQPVLGDVRDYIEDLWEVTRRAGSTEWLHVCRMKKFLNFIAQSVEPEGRFIQAMRRSQNARELFSACDQFLLESDNKNKPFNPEPFTRVVARPNHE